MRRPKGRIGGTPWQYPLRYIENSPIFMVDKITTPLLILHNDADDAVPWYQGIEFFLALRRLNKQAWMYTYNGEPHHLRRRANQKDYAIRMQQFFDYELKGAAKPMWMDKGVPYLHTPAQFSPPTRVCSKQWDSNSWSSTERAPRPWRARSSRADFLRHHHKSLRTAIPQKNHLRCHFGPINYSNP